MWIGNTGYFKTNQLNPVDYIKKLDIDIYLKVNIFIMPYPVAHVLFFVMCICAGAVYGLSGSLLRRELSYRNSMQLILLLFVGGFSALFPDGIIVYNLLVNGTAEHCYIGPIPTHSLLFSSSAALFGITIGYLAYREFRRAFYLGLFAESASLSHLLLDDTFDSLTYFYPIYNKPISLFSMVDVKFPAVNIFHYLIASFVSVSYICFVMMLALFALNRLGFEFRFKPEK